MIVSFTWAVAATAVDVLARTTGVLMASSLALVSLSFLAAALVIRKLRLVAGVVMPSSSSFFLLFSNLCLIRLDCLLPNMMNVDVYYYYWDESVFVAMCHGLFDLPPSGASLGDYHNMRSRRTEEKKSAGRWAVAIS